MKLMNWITWAILLGLFATDYFIASAPEQQLQTCVFWIALVLFNIWRMMIKKQKE